VTGGHRLSGSAADAPNPRVVARPCIAGSSPPRRGESAGATDLSAARLIKIKKIVACIRHNRAAITGEIRIPNSEYYDDRVVRLFLLAAAVWGIIGMAIGVYAAAELM